MPRFRNSAFATTSGSGTSSTAANNSNNLPTTMAHSKSTPSSSSSPYTKSFTPISKSASASLSSSSASASSLSSFAYDYEYSSSHRPSPTMIAASPATATATATATASSISSTTSPAGRITNSSRKRHRNRRRKRISDSGVRASSSAGPSPSPGSSNSSGSDSSSPSSSSSSCEDDGLAPSASAPASAPMSASASASKSLNLDYSDSDAGTGADADFSFDFFDEDEGDDQSSSSPPTSIMWQNHRKVEKEGTDLPPQSQSQSRQSAGKASTSIHPKSIRRMDASGEMDIYSNTNDDGDEINDNGRGNANKNGNDDRTCRGRQRRDQNVSSTSTSSKDMSTRSEKVHIPGKLRVPSAHVKVRSILRSPLGVSTNKRKYNTCNQKENAHAHTRTENEYKHANEHDKISISMGNMSSSSSNSSSDSGSSNDSTSGLSLDENSPNKNRNSGNSKNAVTGSGMVTGTGHHMNPGLGKKINRVSFGSDVTFRQKKKTPPKKRRKQATSSRSSKGGGGMSSISGVSSITTIGSSDSSSKKKIYSSTSRRKVSVQVSESSSASTSKASSIASSPLSSKTNPSTVSSRILSPSPGLTGTSTNFNVANNTEMAMVADAIEKKIEKKKNTSTSKSTRGSSVVNPYSRSRSRSRSSKIINKTTKTKASVTSIDTVSITPPSEHQREAGTTRPSSSSSSSSTMKYSNGYYSQDWDNRDNANANASGGGGSSGAISISPMSPHVHNLPPASYHHHPSRSIRTAINSRNSSGTSADTMSIPSFITHRGIAIDTRMVQTFSGDAMGRSFQKQCVDFMESCSANGILPSIVATTGIKESKSSRKGAGAKGNSSSSSSRMNQNLVTIETSATRVSCNNASNSNSNCHSTDQREGGAHEHGNDWDKMLQLVPIQPPSNVNNTKNRSKVHVPKRLLACDSWRIFGDLIESIIKEADSSDPKAHSRRNDSSSSAIEIIIITNDVALFTDTNSDSHKRALGRLWDRLAPKFDAGKIQSICVVTFHTGVFALQPRAGSCTSEGGFSADSIGVGVGNTGTTGDQLLDDIPHKFKVQSCAKVVQSHISTLLGKEYKRKSGHKQQKITGATHRSDLGMAMDVRFDLKDFHPIHFDSILREWNKGVVSTASGAGRISFDLPETLDGTQCSVILDLSYSILPYPCNSPAVQGMVEDLRSLTSSYFEVVQLAPLNSVDMSLIYGVPFTTRAGLEGDLEQFRDMQKLVRELWRYLAAQDVALVLRSVENSSDSNYQKNTVSSLFLLIAQVTPDGNIAGNGLLCRYVSRSNQILEKPDVGVSDEAADDYGEVISSSLDFLDKDIVNPLLLEGTEDDVTEMYNTNEQSFSSVRCCSNNENTIDNGRVLFKGNQERESKISGGKPVTTMEAQDDHQFDYTRY